MRCSTPLSPWQRVDDEDAAHRIGMVGERQRELGSVHRHRVEQGMRHEHQPRRKHPGITHFALVCPDILAAKAALEAAGIALSGDPIRFGPGAQAIFVRDPDRNVIELHQRGRALPGAGAIVGGRRSGLRLLGALHPRHPRRFPRPGVESGSMNSAHALIHARGWSSVRERRWTWLDASEMWP